MMTTFLNRGRRQLVPIAALLVGAMLPAALLFSGPSDAAPAATQVAIEDDEFGDPVGELVSEADAIVQDLTTIAVDEGISVAQATLLYGWHDEFAQVASIVEALLPNQFAGSQVNPNGEARAVLKFVGNVPSGLSSVLASLPVPVTLVGDALYSMRDQSDLVAAAHYAVRAALPEWSTSTGYDEDNNMILLSIGPADPNNPPTALDTSAIEDLVDLANAAASAIVTNPPTITISQSTSQAAGGTDTIRGGAFLTWGTNLSNYACTSGWPVKKNGSTQKGLITAEHCSNDLLYSGRNVLTWRKRLISSHGDIDYRSSSEVVGKEFYYGTGQYRTIAGLGSAPSSNQKLCKYGRTTGLTCDTVHDRTTCRDEYCNLIAMDHKRADHGDSGGPWFWGSTAYGVHSGWKYDFPSGKHDQYTPIYNTLSELGVSLNK